MYSPGKCIRFATKHFKERGKMGEGGGGRELGRGLQSGKKGGCREAGAEAWGFSADIKRMVCK